MVAGVISAVLAGGYGSASGGAGLVIEATATSQTGYGTSHDVTIPTNNQNDVLIMFGSTQGAVAITAPTNWAEEFQGVFGAKRLGVFSRVAPAGGVSSPVTVTTGDAFAAWIVYRISGSTGDVEAASATGNSANADPPSLTPSWGSAASLWIAAVVTDASAPTIPASYSGAVNISNTATPPLSTASRILTAGTENPGAFTSALSEWVAGTIAVRPA